jgi:hypothetical protein
MIINLFTVPKWQFLRSVQPAAAVDVKNRACCVVIGDKTKSRLGDLVRLTDTAHWKIAAHLFEKRALLLI